MTRTMLTLIRREYWEHRALWVAPLAIAAALMVVAAFAWINFGVRIAPTPGAQRALFGLAIWGFAWPQYLTLSIVLWFYATDCLYAERRDRSILFWKSMPVSDAQTVISKLAVALLVAPLLVYLITVVSGLLGSAIWSVRAHVLSLASGWDTLIWARVEWLSLMGVIISSLWYAPLTAYLLMVSAWARRSPSVWIFLPPLALIVLEHLMFRTHYVGSILWYRMSGIWRHLNLGTVFNQDAPSGADPNEFANRLLASIDPTQALTNIDLWLGLAVAAAFTCIAIYIRRYRDET